MIKAEDHNIIKIKGKWDFARIIGEKLDYETLQKICEENNENIEDMSLYSLSTESGHIYTSYNRFEDKVLSVDINETYKINVNNNIEELTQNYLNGKY